VIGTTVNKCKYYERSRGAMKKMFESELRRRRKALKISQIELARMVGVSLMTIQMWERGAATPKPENKEKLEGVLSTLEKEMGK
jgi:transcriptional regulator with XRE-family HTH domain